MLLSDAPLDARIFHLPSGAWSLPFPVGLAERTTICCSQDDRASVYRKLSGQAAQLRLDIESVVSPIGIFVSSTRNIIFFWTT